MRREIYPSPFEQSHGAVKLLGVEFWAGITEFANGRACAALLLSRVLHDRRRARTGTTAALLRSSVLTESDRGCRGSIQAMVMPVDLGDEADAR